MNKKILISLGFLFFILAAKPALANLTTLNSTADTYLSSKNITSINGQKSFMTFMKKPGEIDPMLVKFDFSTIAKGAKINSAKLRIYQTDMSGPVEQIKIGVYAYPITSDWKESEVNWTLRPTKGEALVPPKGDFYYLDRTIGYTEWDIGPWVQNIIDKKIPNYGLWMEAAVNGWDSHFYSREDKYKPEIVIDYNEALIGGIKIPFLGLLKANVTPNPTVAPSPAITTNPSPVPTTKETPVVNEPTVPAEVTAMPSQTVTSEAVQSELGKLITARNIEIVGIAIFVLIAIKFIFGR